MAMGLDVLHLQPARQRVLPQKWRQAARLCEAASQAAAPVAPIKKSGDDARGVPRQAWGAWRQAALVFAAAVNAAAAAQQLGTALAWCGPQGTLNTRQEGQGTWRPPAGCLPVRSGVRCGDA